MKFISIIALLALSGCAIAQGTFPTETAKVVQLSQKGLASYCKIPLSERLKIRANLNTDTQGAIVWCNAAEKQVLFGTSSYIDELEK